MYLFFHIIFKSMYILMPDHEYAQECSALGSQKRKSGLLELKLTAVVSRLTWVWEPRSSDRAVRTLIPWSLFLSPCNCFKWPMSINTLLGCWVSGFKPGDQLGKNWPHDGVEFSNPWTRVPSFKSDFFFHQSVPLPVDPKRVYGVYAPEQSFP